MFSVQSSCHYSTVWCERARMNRNHWPGLEVDRSNQDEYPTVYDAPHLQPITAVQLQHARTAPLEKAAPESNGRTCGLQKWVFGLVVALVIAVTMGVVGAGVAGSLAARWKADADREFEAPFPSEDFSNAANCCQNTGLKSTHNVHPSLPRLQHRHSRIQVSLSTRQQQRWRPWLLPRPHRLKPQVPQAIHQEQFQNQIVSRWSLPIRLPIRRATPLIPSSSSVSSVRPILICHTSWQCTPTRLRIAFSHARAILQTSHKRKEIAS